MIDAGASLTKELIRAGLSIKASFWFYIPDIQSWRLVITAPSFSRDGPKKFYQIIQKVMSGHPGDSPTKVGLENVSVVATDHQLVKLLSTVIKTGSGLSGLANIRFSDNTVNGQYIDDAFIYIMR